MTNSTLIKITLETTPEERYLDPLTLIFIGELQEKVKEADEIAAVLEQFTNLPPTTPLPQLVDDLATWARKFPTYPLLTLVKYAYTYHLLTSALPWEYGEPVELRGWVLEAI